MLYKRHILPAIAFCALAVFVAACGTDGGELTGGAVVETPTATPDGSVVPTPTAEVRSEATTSARATTPTPTPEAEDDAEELGCSDEENAVEGMQVLRNPEWSVPPSLDEQIFESDTIARATLKSVTAATETIPCKGSSAVAYRPVHELRFTVHEYLKGSGPPEILVVARDDEYTYATVAEAREVADYAMSYRDTTWDNHQAVLFLRTLDGLSWLTARYTPTNSVSVSANTTAFKIYSGAPYESWWHHTGSNIYIGETLSRGWLPAGGSSDGVSGAASVSFKTGGSSFVTNDSMTSKPTVTLGELKTKIAEMAATLKAGESIAGYEECIRRKISRERIRRVFPWAPVQLEARLASGSAAGTEVDRNWTGPGEPEYSHYYVTGPDKEYFQAPIIDADSNPYNGYFYTLSTTRPLRAGVYRIKDHLWHYRYFPCNFKPDDSNYTEWTVTVTAPSGTVHEAFFDPIYVTSTAVVGATTTTGTIGWAAQRVTIDAWGSLPADHHVDFLSLDGSVALRLDADDADDKAKDGGGRSMSWGVCDQPWKAGDKLMLRISRSPENLTGATNDTSCAAP